jgi:hypothetical protein
VILAHPRSHGGIVSLALTGDGRLADAVPLARVAKVAIAATDCFLFCPGALAEGAAAGHEWARFFALLDGVLAPAREGFAPLRLGLSWPSPPFPSAPPWLLRDLCAAEIPRSPEEEAELDALARLLAHADRAVPSLSALHALAFWVMRRRATEVGERFGRERLAPLWRALAPAPRLHLIGHACGASLVTAMVLGGVRPASLTLLRAAFSAFAFAPEVPGFDRPGFHHRLLAERRIDGPVVVLRSERDPGLDAFYGAIGGRAALAGRGGGGPRPGHRARRAAVVAASALGAVGARGVGAPELGLRTAQRTGIPQYPIVNVDGSGLARSGVGWPAARGDILRREIAMLAALAAGLLVGGPHGARPVPRNPRFER